MFHRIDGKDQTNYAWQPYQGDCESHVTNCTFTRCQSYAGGGIEVNTHNAFLTDCRFFGCNTVDKDGGAINVYIYERKSDWESNNIPSQVTLDGCLFRNCTALRDGGAIRSLAMDTTVIDCEFSGCTSNRDGGAIAVTNKVAQSTVIRGSSFDGTVASGTRDSRGRGGAVYTLAVELTIEGYTAPGETTTKRTTFTNCQTKKRQMAAAVLCTITVT